MRPDKKKMRPHFQMSKLFLSTLSKNLPLTSLLVALKYPIAFKKPEEDKKISFNSYIKTINKNLDLPGIKRIKLACQANGSP